MTTVAHGTVDKKWGDPLEAIVKMAGLLALALPLVGIGVRLVAFQLAGLPNALLLATRDSVFELATTAFDATWPSVTVAVLLIVAVNRGWMSGAVTERDIKLAVEHRRYFKARLWLFRAAFASLVLAAFLVLPWPGGTLIGLAGLGMGWAISRLEMRRQLTLYSAAVLVAAVSCLNAVGAGLEGVGVGDEVNVYHFATKPGLPTDGRYVRLGEADGVLYLQSCANPNVTVAVNNSDVARFEIGQASPSETPNLILIVRWHKAPEIGYRPRC